MATATVDGAPDSATYTVSNSTGTNLGLTGLTYGTYTVTASIDGFASQSKTVNLNAASVSVSFAFVHYGDIIATSTLNGAPTTATYVVTDSKNKVMSGLTGLPYGTYTVTASLYGYDLQSKTVTLNAASVPVSFAFVNIGDIVATSTVDGAPATAAYVVTDSSNTVMPGLTGLTYGTYTVTATVDGLAPQSKTVTLNAASVPVSFAFVHYGDIVATSTKDGAPTTATYVVTDSTNTVVSGMSGLPYGTYTVTASLSGFNMQSKTVTLNAASVSVSFEFVTPTNPPVEVSTGDIVPTATLDGVSTNAVAYTVANSTKSNLGLNGLEYGTYLVTATLAGYDPQTKAVTVDQASNPVSFAFVTPPAPVEASTGDIVPTATLDGVSTDAVAYTVANSTGSSWGLTGLTYGTYLVTATLTGYDAQAQIVTVNQASNPVSFVFVTANNGGNDQPAAVSWHPPVTVPNLYHAEFSILYQDDQPVSLVFGSVLSPQIMPFTNDNYASAYWSLTPF